MNAKLIYLTHWLVDFELFATLLLAATLLSMQWIRQPVLRVALGWAVSLALTVLLVITALPTWPRWHALGKVSGAVVATGGTPARVAEAADVPTAAPTVQNSAVTSVVASHAETRSRSPAVTGGKIGAFPLLWLDRFFLLGGAATSTWLILGWVQAAWLCHRGRPAPFRLREQLQAVVGDRETPPRLLLSAHLQNAVAVGILRPTILLPTQMAEQASDVCLHAVLAHELAHIRNRDLGLIGLLRCLLIVLFPQPLFWVLRHLIRDSQEVLADAVASAGRCHDYADGLIGWMRQAVTPKKLLIAPTVGIWERPSELSKRIAVLVDGDSTVHTTVPLRWRVGAMVVIGAVVLGLSVVTLRPVLAADSAQPPTKPVSAVVLAKSPVLSDTNGQAYVGRVLDKTTHEPISGAIVNVQLEISSSTEDRIVQETEHKTDGDGHFPFLVTPEVATNSRAYLNFEVTHPNYARLPWNGYALSMIRKNQTFGERPFFQDLEMTPAESISGTLVRPDGSPAVGVKILTFSKERKNDMAEYGSFADTRTDAAGFFKINVTKGGEAVLWLLPHEFAPSTQLLHQERGDLGKFKLEDGIRLSGQAFKSDGSPAGSIWINAELRKGPAKQPIGMPVMDALGRSALTDDQGRFTMEPLPVGEYDLLASEYARDSLTEDHSYHPVPDTFAHQTFQLVSGQPSASVEIRAVPHVLVTIHQLDSKGHPHRSHEIHISGQLNGNSWWGEERPDNDGIITFKVPSGLADARFDIPVNEHQSTRCRWSDDSPWSNEKEPTMPSLDRDYPNVSVIYYTAPVLLVGAFATDGSAVPGFKCQLEYAKGRKPYPRTPNWINGTKGDVDFEKQTDGRWRSECLLPDEGLLLTVQAEGFQAYSQSVNLPEGTTREIAAQLQKR